MIEGDEYFGIEEQFKRVCVRRDQANSLKLPKAIFETNSNSKNITSTNVSVWSKNATRIQIQRCNVKSDEAAFKLTVSSVLL